MFGSTKKVIEKTNNWENVPSFEMVIPKQFRRQSISKKSELVYKLYGYLIKTEPNNLIFLKTYHTQFDDVTLTFTDKNGNPLKI